MYWEAKKNPSADLNRIRPLLFSISLIITLILIITAFEWKSYDTLEQLNLQRTNEEFEEILEIPPTRIPPPPPPSLQISSIVEIKDEAEIKEEIKVTFDMEITDQTVMEEIKYVEPPKIEEEVSEEIFLVVEQPAAPREGLPAFYKYLATKIRYPALANRLRVEGKVFVEFVVDKDGTLGMFNVVKGIGAGCDEEAVRVLREAPPWAPGKQRGKPVKQRLVLPIHFVMASS